MPKLPMLALRYLLWFIGLRLLFGVLVQAAGLPNATGTAVILAAVPMADIGYQAMRRATRALSLSEWSLIWGMCLGVFVTVQIILPAIILAPMRAVLADPAGLQQTLLVLVATGGMMALFTWIGARAGAARR